MDTLRSGGSRCVLLWAKSLPAAILPDTLRFEGGATAAAAPAQAKRPAQAMLPSYFGVLLWWQGIEARAGCSAAGGRCYG